MHGTFPINKRQNNEMTCSNSSIHDQVQEDERLNKTGILKHVKEIISKLRTVSTKMGNVLEYHQALGLVPLHELDQKCLALKKQQSLEQVKVSEASKSCKHFQLCSFILPLMFYILF